MAQSVVLKGAECKIYLGGKLYGEAQSISYTIDYGESEIYGIDSIFPQEIAATKMSVQGQVSGLRVKLSGGLQGKGGMVRINERLIAPYISIEIRSRVSDKKIMFIPQAKITQETMQIPSKGVVKLNFTFKGIVPYNALDFN